MHTQTASTVPPRALGLTSRQTTTSTTRRSTRGRCGTCPSSKVRRAAVLVRERADASAGGSFDPWGGPGYDMCEVLTGPDFQDVFYKWNWASNVKLISYYMLFGYVVILSPSCSILSVPVAERIGAALQNQVSILGITCPQSLALSHADVVCTKL